MKEIEVFLQGEGLGDIQLVRISPEARVEELVAEAHRRRLPEGTVCVFMEDGEEELGVGMRLTEAKIRHRSRVHCHRCRQVSVTVNFNQLQLTRDFPPSSTIEKVKRWVDKELKEQRKMTAVDAAEHALQFCGGDTRPAEDVHLGTLVAYPDCQVCFDLVPKVRVEG